MKKYLLYFINYSTLQYIGKSKSKFFKTIINNKI